MLRSIRIDDGVFLRNHRRGATWHFGTSHNTDAFASLDCAAKWMTRERLANQRKGLSWRRHVIGSHRVAVHRRIVVRGDIYGGMNRLGEHSINGVSDKNRFRFADRLHAVQHMLDSIANR